MTAAAVTIGKARIAAQRASGPGRQGLQRWLSNIHLARHGLPPQAIVFVRRLQVPAAAFEDARSDPLAPLLRQALRPAQQDAAGAGVAAVWFADEAELLACLARDALADTLGQRWWWPLLLQAQPTPARARQCWQAAPRAVPWALQALQPTRQDAAWLQALGPEGRAALLQALARAYPVGEALVAGLLALEAQAPAPMPHGGPQRWAAGPLFGAGSAWPKAQPAAAPMAGAGVSAFGSPDQAVAAWLRLADVLRRAPYRATQPAMWSEGLPGLPAAGPAFGDAAGPRQPWGRAQPDGGHRRAAHAVSADNALRQRERRALPGSGHSVRALRPVPGWAPAEPGDGPFADPHGGDAVAHRHAPAAAGAALAAVSSLGSGHPSLVSSGAVPRASSGLARLHISDDRFTTGCGGVFFLLNLALRLGLYGDFSRPLQAGLEVSPWRLLLTALSLSLGPATRSDPLRAWLSERAGTHARVAQGWQLPAAALQALPDDARPWHAVCVRGCWQLRHASGGLLALGRAGEELAVLMSTLQAALGVTGHPLVRVHAQVHEPRKAPAHRLQPVGSRLVPQVWPLLRAQLAAVLGLPARAALALCLPLPAQLHVRHERLSLQYSLAGHPLALRLAGLDRDPGWLPAAGCDIRFHFD